MTTLKSLMTLTTATIFLLTSCQKDDMFDLDRQANQNDVMTTSDMNDASSGESRKNSTVRMVDQTAQTYDLWGAQVPNANARGSHACLIKCSSGPVYDSNQSASNNIDQKNMKCENGGDSFKGSDKFYYFKAESSDGIGGKRRYTITLSDLEDDLDLFVYTLDASGYVRECKGISITVGQTDAEVIELTDLNEGYYLIVVDAWSEGIYSSYTLELNCDVVTESTPCWDINGNGKKDLEEDVNIDHVVNEDDCVAALLMAVSYEDDGVAPGELTGSFMQVGISRVWIETVNIKSDNSTYTYEYSEIGRDQWSAYLRDDSRNVTIQIDIAHDRIVAKQDGNAFASYRVSQKYFHPGGIQINGQNLYQISISNSPNGILTGTIEQVEGSSLWRAYDEKGIPIADYREVTRDEWSVYLRDESGDVNLQLNTYHRTVKTLKFDWIDLYHIVAMK